MKTKSIETYKTIDKHSNNEDQEHRDLSSSTYSGTQHRVYVLYESRNGSEGHQVDHDRYLNGID